MRPFKIVFALLFAASLAFSACSTQDPAPPPGSGGSMPDAGCEKAYLFDYRCMSCLQEQCCAEFATCGATDFCLECVFEGPHASKCTTAKAPIDALTQCVTNICLTQCEFYKDDFPDSGCMVEEAEADGGVAFADCKESGTSILRGTVDGQPFDQTFTDSYTSFSEDSLHSRWALSLPSTTGMGGGYMELFWLGYFNTGSPVATIGRLRLPGESTIRDLKPGSMLWFNCEDGSFRFSIVTGEDQLTGCAR